MADGVAGYLSSGRGLTRVLVTVRSNVYNLMFLVFSAGHLLWGSQYELC